MPFASEIKEKQYHAVKLFKGGKKLNSVPTREEVA